VHGISIVPLQATIWTVSALSTDYTLARFRKGYAKDHYDDGYQSAHRARQSDVAKPGRRKRRHGKIERIRVIGDVRIDVMLRFVNNSGHHKNEDRKVGHRGKDFFMSSKEKAVFAEVLDNAKSPQQSKGPQRSEEAGSFARCRNQQ
jgi:hypothetical protein